MSRAPDANYTVVVAPSANTEGTLPHPQGQRSHSTASNPNAVETAAAQPSDSRAPTVLDFDPVDETTDVGISSNIIVTFSEPVQRGSGTIVLKTQGGTTVATYDAVTSANLAISGDTLTINPSTNLAYSTGYKLDFASGALKDLAGNAYAGTSSYNFTTAAPPDTTAPTVVISDNIPGTATGNITYSLVFSETVTGLAASDFTITNGSVLSVAGSDTNYTVVVAPSANTEGTLSLPSRPTQSQIRHPTRTPLKRPLHSLSIPAHPRSSISIQSMKPPTLASPATSSSPSANPCSAAVAPSCSKPRVAPRWPRMTRSPAPIWPSLGDTLTINPSTNLAYSTGYKLDFASGASRISLATPTPAPAVTTSPQQRHRTPPHRQLSSRTTSPATATGNITYSLVFSETVTGLAASDFTITNGSVLSVAGSDTNYTVVVAPSANTEGTLSLTLKANAVTDTASNPNAVETAAAQPIDTRAPTVLDFDPVDETTDVGHLQQHHRHLQRTRAARQWHHRAQNPGWHHGGHV